MRHCRLTHGCTNGGLSIENCTNFAQTMERSDNWKLLFVHFWPDHEGDEDQLSISEVIKMDDGRFGCSVPRIHNGNVKAMFGEKWMQTLGQKPQMNGRILKYTVCRRWGEKYFQFRYFGNLRVIFGFIFVRGEKYLGLYLSEEKNIWVYICPMWEYL